MTDTQELLKKIAALRGRLDQAHRLVAAGGTIASQPSEEGQDPGKPLDTKVRAGTWHAGLLDGTLRQLAGEAPTQAPLPSRLTARGARLLKRGRELLDELRGLLDDPVIKADEDDPLTCLHTETAAMLDALLRTVQAFPPSPSAQIRLCEGLEAVEHVIEERLGILNASLIHRRCEAERLESLAELFRKLGAGGVVAPRHFLDLAATLVKEATTHRPVRFLCAPAEDPARCVAAHSLTVAQVMARLLLDDPEWKEQLEEALLATLLHDVGMVRVPVQILAHPGPLTDEQRRLVERHPNVGAHIISRILPGGGLTVEAATDHHERIDGTGYPAGRRQVQLSAFVRLLAVCDVYAALCARRPYRPAQDTRSALTDTLLLADQGALDRNQAEKLLGLSFYPVGSVVELSDGAVGVVIATHPGRLGMENPSKVVLSLLTGPQGQVLSMPSTVDLLEDERTILRSLPEADRRHLLGKKYPGLA